MNPKDAVNKMLDRFGEEIILREEDKEERTRAVIQPLLYKNKMYLSGNATPIGITDEGHYLMIAKADIVIDDWRSAIVCDSRRQYTIKKSEVISCASQDLYIWAVITPCAPSREDDYEEYDRCA